MFTTKQNSLVPEPIIKTDIKVLKQLKPGGRVAQHGGGKIIPIHGATSRNMKTKMSMTLGEVDLSLKGVNSTN